MSETTRKLGHKLAEGRTAEIFEWGRDQIAKCYRPDAAHDAAEREYALARSAFLAGIPTPQPLRACSIDKRPAVIFERVHGETMSRGLMQQPGTAPALSSTLAGIHTRIHSTALTPALPAQKDQLRSRINRAPGLDTHTHIQLSNRLDALPDGVALCHGDFHTDNVLAAATGYITIDWVDATLGNPLADVANTALLMRHGTLPPGLSASDKAAIAELREAFVQMYLARYCELLDVEASDITQWFPIVAAARLYVVNPDNHAVWRAYVTGP
jgi:aminoglycoside phosphotransferase (APT) family kinase protein